MGSIDSVEGLVSLVAEENRGDAQAFVAALVDEAGRRGANPANAALRTTKSELDKTAAALAALRADHENAAAKLAEADEIRTKLEELSAKHEAMSAESQSWRNESRRFRRDRLVREVMAAGVASRGSAFEAIEDLGLSLDVSEKEDGTEYGLGEKGSAKLAAWLAKPGNRAAHAGGRFNLQSGGPPVRKANEISTDAKAAIDALPAHLRNSPSLR